MTERNNIILKQIQIDHNRLNKAVQEHDPLHIDDFMINRLYELNNKGNVDVIIQELDRVTPNEEPLTHYTLCDALAATRDLGMIAASLARHCVNLETLPRLKNWLVSLSKITGEVPRDTVFSYGPRNHQEDKMRTFTGMPEERLFIQSFTRGMSELGFCTLNLLVASDHSIADPEFTRLVSRAQSDFRNLVSAMVVVRRSITSNLFSNYLRPYFPLLTIDGKTYMAPGGAQMPLILIDRILCGTTSNDEIYNSYYEDNLQYLPPLYRYLSRMIRPVSLIDTALKEIKTANTHTSRVNRKYMAASLIALQGLLTEVQRFRIPHQKTAEENFKIRPEFSIGSGGYTPEILDKLLKRTITDRDRITNAFKYIDADG